MVGAIHVGKALSLLTERQKSTAQESAWLQRQRLCTAANATGETKGKQRSPANSANAPVTACTPCAATSAGPQERRKWRRRQH